MSADPDLDGVLSFLRTAERLKSTPRSGWTTAGERESVAAHTWRLSLMAAVLADRFPGVDLARLLKICLIHDLGEALHGDIPAPRQSSETSKAAREREDLISVLAPLPARLQEELTGLWDEYEAARTAEARLAKGLDKLETILQHTQGLNPPDFDYRFNLTYGQAYTAAHPILAALRARLDQETEARAGGRDDVPRHRWHTRWAQARAAALHLYTACGALLALLATIQICAPAPDPRRVFALLAAAVLVDATDGPLARRWEVKRWLPAIDGRTIDDIVDYLTYTFVPLLLVWRMGWVPEPGLVWVAPPLLASLFGFANTGIKDEAGGFFLGFPSYWNIVAFYAGLVHWLYGPAVNAAALVLLAVATVLPIRFLYPNLAPHPWRRPVIAGAFLWLAALLWMLPVYPQIPAWALWLSLAYPAFYVWLSFRAAGRRSG